MQAILKSNNFYKKQESFYKYIKFILNFNISKNNNLEIIKKLHNFDIENMYDKNLYFYITDDKSMWGAFKFDNNWDNEEQKIKIYSFENLNNNLYKNSLMLATYLHETTHEKQRDYFMFNNIHNLPEENQYNNLLNYEIVCFLEADLPKYEQRLLEIDAIYNAIVRYNEIMNKIEMADKLEVVSVQLYNCVRYIASINLEEHHTYCPEQFTTNSNQLVEYYKDFYSNYRSKYNNETIDELIKYSEYVRRDKKDELKQVNFEEVKKEINKKTQIVMQIMKNNFNKIIQLYKPSTRIKDFLNVKTQQDWQQVLKQNNIVKISALICDDMYAEYANQSPSIIPEKETIDLNNER